MSSKTTVLQIFLQYYYSAILNIELHCSKYCKKKIIFYLTLSPLSLISHLCLSIAEPSTRNPAPQSTANPTPYHAIEHGENQHDNPQPMIHNRSSVSTSLSWSEWNFGFYWSRVVKFRIFCLWVLLIDAFLVDLFSFGCLSWWIIVGLFHQLAGNEGFGESYRWKRAENEREERDGREDIILRYIILLCTYIILMSKRGK